MGFAPRNWFRGKGQSCGPESCETPPLASWSGGVLERRIRGASEGNNGLTWHRVGKLLTSGGRAGLVFGGERS